MHSARRLAVLGITVLCLYLLSSGSPGERLRQAAAAGIEAGRMKNVTVEAEPLPTAPPAPAAVTADGPAWIAEAEEADGVLVQVMESVNADEIRETTIGGGLAVKNETQYAVDARELLGRGPSIRLPSEGPQILILHTHASEAYTPAGLVGDELASIFERAGLRVLHDREIYDYPSYTGSYTRSGEAVERYLAEYPDIAVVLDIHRDALGSEGVVYKTMAEEEGVVASQVMLLAGSDESGLAHPDWRENLTLALYLQERVGMLHPTLMRPVSLVPQRYNQHLTRGSLILEVGSSGNTLQEALSAIRLFGEAAAPALAQLVESPAGDA